MKTVMKRKQKIYYQHYGCKGNTHPFIRIAGQYLKRFGFNVGDIIEAVYITIDRSGKTGAYRGIFGRKDIF
jgi:hypothetical protein